LRRCHTFFDKYWQNMMTKNVIRVPQGCPTVEKAMALAVVFSERKVYTKTDPLKIRLDKGVHEIAGFFDKEWGQHGKHRKFLNVTCSHITFVGEGKDQTTIRGGIEVKNQQNITFEELAIINPSSWCGLYLRGNATTVDVLKCIVKQCGREGMWVLTGATVTATQCEFMENGSYGVACHSASHARLNDCSIHHNLDAGLNAYEDAAVVDLHGTKTSIHSNYGDGILADYNGKVNIHLLSQHNTSHDNDGQDRRQEEDGTIANINADGTFTHVVANDNLYVDDY
jgi:hypothetical protein